VIDIELIKKIEKAIPEYKYTHGASLGNGTRGEAVKYNNDVVLKITNDKSEANASNLIKGKKLKYVNEIYDVFKIKYPGNETSYLIFQKFLQEIEDSDVDMVNFFCEYVDGESDFQPDYLKKSADGVSSLIDYFCDKWEKKFAPKKTC